MDEARRIASNIREAAHATEAIDRRRFGVRPHSFFDPSPIRTHVPTISYLTSSAETTGSVSRLELSFCNEAKLLRGEL